MPTPKLIALLAAGATLACAAPALAAPIDYCVQNGASPAVPCPPAYAGHVYQDVSSAVTAAQTNGDTVRVEPGTYNEHFATGGRPNLVVFGDPAQPRPVLTSTGTGGDYTIWINLGASGTVLRHLEIRQLGSSDYALRTGSFNNAMSSAVTLDDVVLGSSGVCLLAYGAITATDLTASATGSGACVDLGAGVSHSLTRATVSTTSSGTAVTTAGPLTVDGSTITAPAGAALQANQTTLSVAHSTLAGGSYGLVTALSTFDASNSLITESLTSGTALLANASSTGTLRNVTVYGAGSGSTGARASSGAGMFSSGSSLTITNSILRGGSGGDVTGTAGIPNGCTAAGNPVTCGPGQVSVAASNYRAGGVNITDQGANQSGDPLFTSAGQDFRLLAGSPAINAGNAVPAGDKDLVGTTRPSGAAPDMGAYEYVAPPVTDPGTGGGTTDGGTSGGGTSGGGTSGGGTSGGGTTGGGPTGGGTTPPPAISNLFTVTSRKASRAGTVTIALLAPGAGSFVAKGAAKRKGRVLGFALGHAAAPGAGAARITLRPGKAARRALRSGRTLKVRVAVTFTPAGGVARTLTTTLRVRGHRR